jgi:ABC-2 type transport system permease protein
VSQAAAPALGYLLGRSARNRLTRLSERLRNPRYAVAFAIGALYFWQVFGRRMSGGSGDDGALPDSFKALVFLPFVLMTGVWWILGAHASALALTPAEGHFLVSGPVTRRQLITYKLLGKQPTLFFSVLFFTAVLWRGHPEGAALGYFLRMFASAWVVFTTMQLHQIAASLVTVAAAEQGKAGLRRSGPALIVFGLVSVVIGSALFDAMGAMRASADLDGALDALASALAQPGPKLVLLPVHWITAPFFADGAIAWLAAMPAALGLLALHFVWIVRSQTAFEEGALAAGRAQAEAAATDGRRRGTVAPLSSLKKLPKPWFDLAPYGNPAVAIFWKNLTLAARQMRMSMLRGIFLVMIVSSMLLSVVGESPQQAARVLMGMALTLTGMFALIGPLTARNDLRADLKKIDLLRTYPLRGREIVAAEIAASASVLVVVVLAVFLFAFATSLVGFPGYGPAWAPFAEVGAGLLVLPPVLTLLVTAQNGLALLLPAWIRVGADRPGGIEATGMTMLMVLAQLIFLALALVPAVVTLAMTSGQLIGLGFYALIPGAIAACAVLWAEVYGLISWLGDRYDAIDPAEAGLLE